MPEIWKPGSFTKNFSWGRDKSGLTELYAVIRAGFADRLEDVPRAEFRDRIKRSGRPDYIPINFFLFNRNIRGVDTICADELVFQALSWDHSPAFDRVALFAFAFSFAGKWKGATQHQRRPAMWANAYIRERVAPSLHWDAARITANDIQNFVANDPRYQAETSRKLSTNLNFLLHIGRIGDFGDKRVTRWWTDCVFLALDRLVEDSLIDGRKVPSAQYGQLLAKSGFTELTGGGTLEKDLATKHLLRLYAALGGRARYSEEAVLHRMEAESPADVGPKPNDPRPRGAIHRTNPAILKSIPSICAPLAKRAGFDVLSPDEMENLRLSEFIHDRTSSALAVLREKGVRPTLTIEELRAITRDEE